MRRYAIVVEKGPTSYGAYVPDLPGCVAAAETRPEVLQLIREAIEFHIDTMREDGLAVPELGARMALGEEVGDFFQFQCGFEGDREIKLPAEEEQAVHGRVFLRDRFHLIAELEYFFDLSGQLFERLDDPRAFGSREMTHPAEEQTDRTQDGDLRRERFRGGDADLGAGVHGNAAVALARNCAGDVVADA